VDELKAESSKVVAVGPGWLISKYCPVEVRRSIRNRNTGVAVELHANRICDEEIVVAVRVGADGSGAARVVTVASLEYPERPAAVSTRIR